MIIGIGIDIAEVDRIREAIERHGDRFLARVYTPSEIAYCRSRKNWDERFAARFAAKEAGMKALGTGWRGGVTWQDFEVTRASSGKPSMKLSGKGLEIYRSLNGRNITLSITHTHAYALAQVVIESVDETRGKS
jgi:holo-[acyl-carrier protein] synthase